VLTPDRTAPAADWQPGDPLYPPPPSSAERWREDRRSGMGWPMRWRADGAVPGPWTWLQPGPTPAGREAAA
jgi:hypothetical protein